jgi:hypothetical protein
MKAAGARRAAAMGWAMVLWAMVLQSPAIATAQAAADDTLDSVMSLLAQRHHGEANFTEEKTLSVMQQPLKSSGVLIYDAPDHLEQRTLLPRPQSVVLDHGMLSMHIGTRTRTLRLSDYPQLAPLIDSIRATLAGERATLERVFEVTFTGTVDHWQLHLVPRDPQISATLQQIDLEGQRDAVSEVRVAQRDGDRALMHISARE